MTWRTSALLLAAGGLLAAAVGVPANAAPTEPRSLVSATKVWTTHYCYGRTVKVSDGDTIDVRLTKGCFGWASGKVVVVRNASIQATEVKHPGRAAQCWSAESLRVMRKEFPKGSRVRLGAYTKTLSDVRTSDGRQRYVMYAYSYHPKRAGGPWFDAQAIVVAAGLAFPKGEHVEQAHNIRYLRLTQQAIAQRKGMWGDPSHCGTHARGAKLKGWTGWKANGRDSKSTANTEWFKVRNVGAVNVSLYGWQVRDASHTFGGGKKASYVIKARAILRPGQTMTLYPGNGTNNPSSLKWFNKHPRLPFYPNAHAKALSDANAGRKKWTSDYGYATMLLDPSGNVRAQAVYPCVYKCVKPGLRVASVNPRGDESAVLVNTGQTTLDLTGMVVQISSARREFRSGATLAPGARITVHFTRAGTDTASDVYFGSSAGRLSDRGGKVWLRTADAVTMSMYSWGSGGSYVF